MMDSSMLLLIIIPLIALVSVIAGFLMARS